MLIALLAALLGFASCGRVAVSQEGFTGARCTTQSVARCTSEPVADAAPARAAAG